MNINRTGKYMRISSDRLVYIIIILFLCSAFPVSIASANNSITFWNKEWSYRQEIQIPIQTNDSYSINQPIDIRIIFDNQCWTKDENETSVRVCCWNGKKWFELESQIYDLNFLKTDYLQECSLVFLVPEIADGNEKYYVYYDDSEKSSPGYKDHLIIEDSTYSFSPISSISVEARYYGIKEDDFYIYCIGQEGKILNREFSQIVVKQKKDREKIDVLDSDQIASFAFSYYYGDKEWEESSSDQSFISKEILVDGNLMVEFGIKSESHKKDVKTTAIYRYYYSPGEEKRLSVRVKHEMQKAVIVKGKENIDGRFGMMASFKSRSPAIEKLNVGNIYPYLHFFGENNNVKEYRMNLEPESKKREWIVSYKDDADLGEEAWIGYGYGERGRINSIIFSSNTGIVESGTGERDGIQIKVAEKEYFDFLSAEVDYASINFGRNSFETGYSHDLRIPEDFVAEFDAELFTSNVGGYQLVRKEAKMYQKLVKYRYFSEDPTFEKIKKKHDLTVFVYFGGTRFTYPRISNFTGNLLPVMCIELFQDGKLVSYGEAKKTLFIRYRAYKKFLDITEGDYLVKVFWKIDNSTKFFNGAKTVTINRNKRIDVFCLWERPIQVTFVDQQAQGIKDVSIFLLNQDGYIFDEKTTDENGKVVLKAPWSFRDSYLLQAFYKDLLVCEEKIKNSVLKVRFDVEIKLFDLTIEVEDRSNLPPGVDITPTLSNLDNNYPVQLIPIEIEPGKYFFKNIPSGDYIIAISYANFIDEKVLNLPDDGEYIIIEFSPTFKLNIELFDSHANPLFDKKINFKIFRSGKKILESDETEISLPPAFYKINAYSNGELIGFKEVDFTNDRNIKLVTKLSSPISTIIIGSAIVVIGVLMILFFKKFIDLMSLFKFLAIALIIIALFQPWWGLAGSSTQPMVQRTTWMFLNPHVMVESTFYNGETNFDIAELPELFVDFLGIIVMVAYIVCLLIFLSFISKKLGKKQYSFLLNFLAIILIIAILIAFHVGTSNVTEASIGDVQGDGILSIQLKETVLMDSHWGFSSGFYLMIIAVILAIVPIIIDIKYYVSKKNKL